MIRRAIPIIALVVFFNMNSEAQNNHFMFRSTFIDTPPVIDGVLTEGIWDRNPDIEENFISYGIVYGDTLPEKTRVWIANDESNLYFAIHCLDSQVEKIKTSVTERDNIWQDDWVGFNVDLIGNQTSGYVLCSNASGIQGDLFDTHDKDADMSTDYVWYNSAGIVKDGFVVEFCLPLKNFKYKAGKDVLMNIIFERKIQRINMPASWPKVILGKSYIASMAKLLVTNLESDTKMEIIPSLTYNNYWQRTTPQNWIEGKGKTEFGVSGKIGVTSSITAEATYNPDFSHIESDAFQVLVNQRYPIYYTEKRPFFMEAGNSLDIAGGNLFGKNLVYAVHTRKIIDPSWGGKIFGDLNNFQFGVLVAGDEWPGRKFKLSVDGTDVNSFEGRIADYFIGRVKYSFSNENHIGAIIMDREFAGGYNRVVGEDINLKMGNGSHLIKANVLNSFSQNESTLEISNGLASNFAYTYISKTFELNADYEYIDTEFEMATAFIQRKGISKLASKMLYNFYPQTDNLQWIQKVYPFVWGIAQRDLMTKEYDYAYIVGLNLDFIKQGSYRAVYHWFQEFWAGKTLTGNFFNTYGQIQLTNWLRIYAQCNIGDRIYYSLSDPFTGKGISTVLQLTIQLNKKLTQYFEHQYQSMYKKETEEKVYDINILLSKTTYQLDKHFMLRALIQYDSYGETVLVDALVSYELIPGTVLQIGYGSLYENLYWQNDDWMKDKLLGKYYNTNQSVFVKMSYLLQY